MAKDFLNSTHVIDKHQPWGISSSGFKATLSPSGGYLNIELRVKYSFPVGWRLVHPSMSESHFKQKVADMVDNVWSGRYAISIEGDTDKRKVTVLPKVIMVEAGGDAHFTIDVQRMGSGRSFVTDGRCAFFTGAVNYKPSALAMKIGYKATFGEWSHDRAIYRDAENYTKGSVEREIVFNKNSLDPKNPLAARTIADAMKEHADVWPILPLKLTGSRLPDEDVSFAKRRAENLQKLIKAAGAPNVPIETVDGGVIVRNPLPIVKVEVVNARSQFLDRANNFPIAAHEVGHMLGLADEYESDTAGDAGTINTYARRAGLTIPPFAQNTSSLMSQGDKFLPYHYVTFHHAITTMVTNFQKAYPVPKDPKNPQPTEGLNRDPKITIVESLLKKSDPRVLDPVDLSNLFDPATTA